MAKPQTVEKMDGVTSHIGFEISSCFYNFILV